MQHTPLSFLVLIVLLAGCNRTRVQSQPVSYDSIKSNIEQQRLVFASRYTQAEGKVEKEKVVAQARTYIFGQLVNEIFPAWYGTPWSFEGTTTEPHKGSIACGYFVTTALRDAGFKLPRVKWAQVPSETMIKSITDKNSIKHYSSIDVNKVEAAVQGTGTGIYIAGLDNHVGFLVNNGNEVSFVHSDYYNPFEGVKSVPVTSYNPLSNSNYRVIGKILNDEMVIRWLKGEKLDG